jgi:hypothetical protein
MKNFSNTLGDFEEGKWDKERQEHVLRTLRFFTHFDEDIVKDFEDYLKYGTFKEIDVLL